MLCFAFNLRHGRVAVRKNDDNGFVIVSFQPYTKRKGPGKATDLIFQDGRLAPDQKAPWWLKKTVKQNRRLKEKGHPKWVLTLPE